MTSPRDTSTPESIAGDLASLEEQPLSMHVALYEDLYVSLTAAFDRASN